MRRRPPAFRADVARARAVLEDAGGVPVVGYRAATFSIGRRNPWAFAELEAAGYRYSSSVFPVRHDLYGMPEAPRLPFRPQGTGAVGNPDDDAARWRGARLPWSGGGYFRLHAVPALPARAAPVNAAGGQRAVFYFHPWEIDPGQPRVAGAGWRSRFRHYTNLHATAGRLDRLLRDFAWDRMDRVFADLLGTPAEADGASTCKPLEEAAIPAWDRFVAALPQATFFHRAGWRAVIERAFGHAPTTRSPSGTARSSACCRWCDMRTRLFGRFADLGAVLRLWRAGGGRCGGAAPRWRRTRRR